LQATAFQQAGESGVGFPKAFKAMLQGFRLSSQKAAQREISDRRRAAVGVFWQALKCKALVTLPVRPARAQAGDRRNIPAQLDGAISGELA
jgi:hypothetical protein